MKPYYLETVKRKLGFYWRIRCRRNGKKTAIGGEPFASKQSCTNAFKKVSWVNLDQVDLKK